MVISQEVMSVPDKGPSEEEPSFRVTDRRRMSPEDSQEPTLAPDPQEKEAAETPPTEFFPTSDLVRLFIGELQTRALIHMGLIPNPVTRLVARDLPQARLAIDCLAALIEQLTPSAGPAECDELQQILTDLRFTFVRQSGG
jgi:hypothetical protein